MAETFTASNGLHVGIDTAGGIVVGPQAPDGLLATPRTAEALRQFFRAETDAYLKRWRCPENARLTVYPTPGYEDDEITILDEVDAETYTVTRDQVANRGGWWHLAARAYFDAHPEPKPWHDAKPGEVWAIRFEDSQREVAMRAVDAGHTRFWPIDGPDDAMTYGARSHAIVAARRIWPEDAS